MTSLTAETIRGRAYYVSCYPTTTKVLDRSFTVLVKRQGKLRYRQKRRRRERLGV